MINSDQIRDQHVITDWMRHITVISSHLLKLDLLRNSLCDGSLRALLAPHRWKLSQVTAESAAPSAVDFPCKGNSGLPELLRESFLFTIPPSPRYTMVTIYFSVLT